jgi:hypothetical protein
MLFAPEHAGRDARRLQLGGDLLRDEAHGPALIVAQRLQPAADGVVGDRVEVLEGQLLELGGHAVHADRAGERGVDVERLTGDPLALGGLLDMAQRAHVVQPVGELDHQHAHVAADRQDELAQVLGLTKVLGRELQLGELGHAFDQLADLGAEQLVDLGAGDRCVLDHVVQQGGDDRCGVEPVVGEDAGHLDGMGEVRIARGALLRPVHAHGVDVRAVEQPLVGRGVVGADFLDQLELAEEFRPRPRRLERAVLQRGGGARRRLSGKRFCAFRAQYRSS